MFVRFALVFLTCLLFSPSLEGGERNKKFDPHKMLEGYVDLSFEAPKEFNKRLERIESRAGERLSEQEIEKIQKEWTKLAADIRRSLEKTENDPLEAAIADWERKASYHPVLRRFGRCIIGRGTVPFVLMVSRKGGVSASHVSRLENALIPILTDLEELFEAWVDLPEPEQENYFPLYLTADPILYERSLHDAGGMFDGRVRGGWFSKADKGVFGILTKSKKLEGEALDELRCGCLLAMLDTRGLSGMTSVRAYWMVGGLSRAVAGYGKYGREFRKREMTHFLEASDSLKCRAAVLFGPDGVPHPLGASQSFELPPPEELAWREVATHAIAMSLLEANGGAYRSVFLEAVADELAGRGGDVSLVERLGLADSDALLEMAEDAARDVLARKEIEVRPRGGGLPTLGKEPTTLKPGIDPEIQFWMALQALDIEKARTIAEEGSLRAEFQYCRLIEESLLACGEALEAKPKSVTLPVSGKKKRGKAQGLLRGFILFEIDGRVERIAIEDLGAEPVFKLVKKLHLSGSEVFAGRAYLGTAALDFRSARKDAAKAGSHREDVEESIDRLEGLAKEIEVAVELEALFEEEGSNFVSKLKRFARKHRESPVVQAQQDRLRDQLLIEMKESWPSPSKWFRSRYPNASWNVSTGRVLLTHAFERVDELDVFDKSPYAAMEALPFVKIPSRVDRMPFLVVHGALVSKGHSHLRLPVVLAPPMRVSFERAFLVPKSSASSSVLDLEPEFVIGLADDTQGRFLGVRGEKEIFRSGGGEMETLFKAQSDPRERGHFAKVDILFDGREISVTVDGVSVGKASVEGYGDGSIFLWNAGVLETHIRNLEIEGGLTEQSVDASSQAALREKAESIVRGR